VSRNNRKGGAKRTPQHRINAGRHREVPPAVADLVSMPANTGTKIAAIGVLGSTTALAVPGMAAAATAGGPGVTAPAAGGVSAAPLAGFTTGGQLAGIPGVKPTVRIVVIGDSFTSGEGANSSTYTTTPMQISPLTGDAFPPLIYPQHQSTNSAVMQAIGALQAANPDVNFQVTNVSVSGATRTSAAEPSQPGTFFEQPSQLSAVQNADIVYNGFAGGNDNNFSDWAKNALVAPDSFMPTVWNSLYLPKFTSGQNLTDQQNFLNNLAQLAPGATIITPSYPMPFQGQTSPSWSLGSPFVSSLGQNAANLSDLFAQWLNADSQAATGNANVANVGTGNTFLDVNMLNALSGHPLTSADPGMNGVVPFSWGQGSVGQSSLHPNPLGQGQEASAIFPVLAAAANRFLGQQGFSLNTDPPPSIQITPAYQQNADGVQAQLSLITKFQQANDLTNLVNQAQNGQTTNPDGSLTSWGQLLAGLNLDGQQPPPAWPDTPTSGSQNGSGAAPQQGTPQQGTPQQGQPMPDITGGYLPPEFGGAPQYPASGAWGGGPQGGGPQQGGTPEGQPGGPGGAAPAPPAGASPGDTNPAPGGTSAAPGGTNPAPGGTGSAAPGGDTSSAPGGASSAPGGASSAPASTDPSAAPPSGAAAPASQPATPATPSSFTSTPDPTNPSPGSIPGPVTSAPVIPASAVTATAVAAALPTVTPAAPAISTPAIATTAAVSTGGGSFGSSGSATVGDPAPVVMAGGSGGGAGSG
jgi:hypothetical protein